MSESDLPPLSPPLVEAVRSLRPVHTRSPAHTVALVLAASLATVAGVLAWLRPRPDLYALPRVWFFAIALAWFAAFAAPLAILLRPPPRSMLPNVVCAARLALALAGVTLGKMVAIAFDLPLHMVQPSPDLWAQMASCFVLGLAIAVVPAACALVALRGVVMVGTWRVGAALGAASGALGGLLLHLRCPVGGLHPAIAHAGCVAFGACFVAWLAPRVLER